MGNEARDPFPRPVRQALAELLLAALRDPPSVAVLEWAVEFVRLPAGARARSVATAAERAAIEFGVAAGLWAEPTVEDARRPGGESAGCVVAPRSVDRSSPEWESDVRARLETYLEVVRAVPPGSTLPVALEQARELFARELFFEVHEVLEPLWQRAIDPERRVLQGVIQGAVARYHLERGNSPSARTLAGAAADKLRGVSSPWHGFAVAEVEQASRRLAEWLAADAAEVRPPAPFVRTADRGASPAPAGGALRIPSRRRRG